MSTNAIDEAREAGIWQAYRAELFRFVLKRVRDDMLAEDIVHDVFIKAHTHAHNLKDPGKLRPWLYRITRNALVDHYRSRRPMEPVPEDLVSESGGDHRAEQELARLSGAKSRVQRARRMLRDVLLRCCRVEIDKRGGVVDYAAADGGDSCTGC